MSRLEANSLLPRLALFGSGAERWLIDGLRSKKAFMRQGCALALARLGSPLAIDALVRLLFAEPTEIWTEIARALGDVGAPAVMPLAARLREVEGDERDRIVQALAHVAARATDEAPANREAVEALASGRDALVANVARRALVLAPEVRTAHQAVRNERREQTLVRAFTRRFYDNLEVRGPSDELEPEELSSDELEALDEELLESASLEDDLIEEEDDDDEPQRAAAASLDGETSLELEHPLLPPRTSPGGKKVGAAPTGTAIPLATASRPAKSSPQ
jgi:hypothetical protein